MVERNSTFIQSLTDDKCDRALGLKVRERLEFLKVETPRGIIVARPQTALVDIQDGLYNGMVNLGLDMSDDSLKDTPRRFAKMLVGELTRGLDYDFFPKCTTVKNKMRYDQMVRVENIQVMSLCEHHLQTIDGVAHIAYIPKTNILGLSKFARVVEFFCRRPQVQERLTEQVFRALELVLETDDIAVVIKATHYCMKARGAMQQNSFTTTDKMGGKFMENSALRQEFLHGIS